MIDFWKSQMDSVFFIYGLSFIFLAVSVWRRNSFVEGRLPWNFLALFGILHGVNELLDMAVLGCGDSLLFKWVRLIVMIASFVPLVEFGRSGLKMQGVRVPGWGIYFLLFALAGTGYFFGMNGLNAFCRYLLGFPGGVLTGIVLWRKSFCVKGKDCVLLRLMGTAFLVYGPATGLIVPKADFFPAGSINHDSFLAWAGFPIQLVRTCCAGITAMSAILYFNWPKTKKEGSKPWGFFVGVFGVTVFLLIGILVANWRSEIVYQYKRLKMLNQAESLARTINLERIRKLSFSEKDKKNAEFLRLTQQITTYQKAVGLESVHCLTKMAESIIFGLGDAGTDLPIGSAYKRLLPQDREVFVTGKSYAVGPVRDEEGVFFLAGAPVRDPYTEEVVLDVRISEDFGDTQGLVTRMRFFIFSGFVLLTGLVFLGMVFISRQRQEKNAMVLRCFEAELTGGIFLVLTFIGMFFRLFEILNG